MADDTADIVSSAFAHVRREAARRYGPGKLPALGVSRAARTLGEKASNRPAQPLASWRRGGGDVDLDGEASLRRDARALVEHRGLKKTNAKPTGRDGRALRRGMAVSSLGSVLSREVQARGWEKHLAKGWVEGHWHELVGEAIAGHTRIEMIKETTVFISCDSTSWATNLRMMQRQILGSIAEKVGPGIITELKIFGPKAPSWRKGRLHVSGRGPRDTYG